MMSDVTRKMDETPAEWLARTTGDYVAALTAFQIEWQRLAIANMSLLAAGYPTLDDGYDGALDSLDDADNERREAATELDRESLAIFRTAPRIKWRHGGRFGIHHK
jgi:hypothetical protein